MAADASVSVVSRLRAPSVVGVLGSLFVLAIVFWLVVNLIKNPSDFFEVTSIGLTNGCVYALVALGYTLVYGILELINFAHGDVFMLGGMFTITYANHVFGMNSGQGALLIPVIIGTMLLTMLTCGALNAMIEFLAYRPLRSAPRLAPLITAIGVSFIIQNVALAIWGPEYVIAPDVLPRSDVVSIGSFDLQWNKVIAVIITVPVLARSRLPDPQHAARQGDARDRPGQGCERDDGHQRQPDDFVHVHDRRRARGCGRGRVRALLHERQVRSGLPARTDRLHGGRPRGDRQPAGRRAGRRADRTAPGLERGAQLARAGLRLDRSRSSSGS